jgi:tight adherence protein B
MPCLAAGLPPAAALRIAAAAIAPGTTAAVSARSAAEDAARGLPVGERLHQAAAGARDDDLAHLARAWQLSESLGAPLGDAVATCARAVRERQTVSRKLGAATAGAHTSMGVLALLPVVGPVAALFLGVSPVQLFASRVSAVSAVMGLALAASGWAWARALVRRAARPRSL